MIKVDDGEEKRKKKKKKKEKIMTFIVATNVIASRPPECRPTGTPHTRAYIDLDHPPLPIHENCQSYQANLVSWTKHLIQRGVKHMGFSSKEIRICILSLKW